MENSSSFRQKMPYSHCWYGYGAVNNKYNFTLLSFCTTKAVGAWECFAIIICYSEFQFSEVRRLISGKKDPEGVSLILSLP